MTPTEEGHAEQDFQAWLLQQGFDTIIDTIAPTLTPRQHSSLQSLARNAFYAARCPTN